MSGNHIRLVDRYTPISSVPAAIGIAMLIGLCGDAFCRVVFATEQVLPYERVNLPHLNRLTPTLRADRQNAIDRHSCAWHTCACFGQ